MMAIKKKCDQCDVVAINGVVCHEFGCPNKWQDEMRECEWCGCMYLPKRKTSTCCNKSCAKAHYT